MHQADGLGVLARLLWSVGSEGTIDAHSGDAHSGGWLRPALKAWNLEPLNHTAIVSHHLVELTRDCLRGTGELSFYAPTATAPAPPEAARA